MGSVITFVLVASLALLIVRIATVALTLTGLSRDMASFQARSAYTGVGFTTVESEAVVTDPQRRKIIKKMMLLGHAGLVTSASTLIIGFSDSNPDYSLSIRLTTLLVGLIALWGVAYSKTVDKHIFAVTELFLRRFTDLAVKDYTTILEMPNGHAVVEITVAPGSSLVNRSARELGMIRKGIIFLCIRRGNGDFVAEISASTEVLENDRITLYARKSLLKELVDVAKPNGTAHQRQ